MKITNKHVLFWDGIFSNWHPVKDLIVEVNGEIISFPTSEHLFMYLKAIYFSDFDTAEQIKQATTPKEAKKLGRRVRGFKESQWEEVRENFMYQSIDMKRRADSNFEKELLKEEHRDKTFVEASPFDKVWGIGLKEDDLGADNEEMWLGLNLLGKTLTKLRDDIIRDKESV